VEEVKEYLKTLLSNLIKPIPHHWRVQSYSKNKPSATVMAYIDARDAQEVLDTYCEYGWHREHYMVDGKVYCKVGIVMPDSSIQWRSDCGTESNQDAEKGQSSDSFKRACVNFGIGRFLYDLPIQYVDADAIKADQDKKDGDKIYKRFPNPIDKQGKRIWDMTAYVNGLNPNAPKAPAVEVKKPNTEQEIADSLREVNTVQELTKFFNSLPPEHHANKIIVDLFSKRKAELKTPELAPA
jgi:hypothetical protein